MFFLNHIKSLRNHIGKLFTLAFLLIFIPRFISIEQLIIQLKPSNIYNFNLSITYKSDRDVSISTYIPQENERQKILSEQIINNNLDYISNEDDSGKRAYWSGYSTSQQVAFRYTLINQAIKYEISPTLKIPKGYSSEIDKYLSPTEAIQSQHKEVKQLWNIIKPKRDKNILPVVRAIYEYTNEQIMGAPFKGLTDALTTLRLKTASCNGKSRLFIALARYNNIPARLVGGVILNGISKKTSHQWVEVYIENQWVPFGPTNGNFAELPQNYLELYWGDENLFRHSSDINFDYQFSSNSRLVAPAVYTHHSQKDDMQEIDITGLLLSMGLNPMTIGLFLLFPICTLLLTFLRNIVGVKTFGIFLPMLIAAACIFTGFWKGITGFTFILLVSFIAHYFLDKLKLLKVPRLAAIITINTMVFVIGLLYVGASSRLQFGMLSLFPVIIISFVAEKIHKISEEGDWFELLKRVAGTFISVLGCYFLLSSFVLQGLFSFYPELYLLVLAAQIYIGQWTGIRLNEIFRFTKILGDNDNPVLGINSRNREFIYSLNSRKLLDVASDKLETKRQLKQVGIPIPSTLYVVKKLSDINDITQSILLKEGFALKPNQGSQGNGIIIIKEYRDGYFYGANNKIYTIDDIKRHCSEIISGSYSQKGEDDIAYFEPLIIQNSDLQKIAPYGLSDIRVILCKGEVISAMLRMPTLKSSGKANLHQGAIGIAIDTSTGITFSAKAHNKNICIHPDSKEKLLGVEIDDWSTIIDMCIKCYQAIPLGYIGIDICIDKKNGPLVLEVNGRPGIEIQNIQQRGFYFELTKQ